jgi:hypothetical protein
MPSTACTELCPAFNEVYWLHEYVQQPLTGVVCTCHATGRVFVLQAALPLRRSTYEERWQQFEAWPASKPVTFKDVPWPCPTPGSHAAERKQEQQQQVLQLDPKQLQTLVLAGRRSGGCCALRSTSVATLAQTLRTVYRLQPCPAARSPVPCQHSAPAWGWSALWRGPDDVVFQKVSQFIADQC